MSTFEGELELEFESEPAEQGMSGSIGNVLGGLLGEGEEETVPLQHEFEVTAHLPELEGHPMHEYEREEQFFKTNKPGYGRFVRYVAPIFTRIARVAAPIVGTAIRGPVGAVLGRVTSSALGELELEQQQEVSPGSEFEGTGGINESVQAAHEIVHHEVTDHEAIAEMMAQQAAFELNEGQAEAMVGAAVITTLSARDRRALRGVLPHLIRGVAILTRILRRRRITRPAVRAVPTIVRRTVQTLKRQAAFGVPITRGAAARAATTQVRQVLGNPSVCAAAISANLRANRKAYDWAFFESEVGSGASAVDPFPRHPYVLGLEMTNEQLSTCAGAVERDPDTNPMCGAVADLTGNPELPPFYAHNPVDMLYVGSLAKIYAMYVAFELRKRVQEQVKDMMKLGLSTATAGWERQVFAALERAWKPKLKAAFRTLPEGMPKFSEIFVLSSTGQVKFAENDPPLTNADLDFWPPDPRPGHDPIRPDKKVPLGKFRDWMRLMLRWSNNQAASKCIRALTYPYINGVLGAAGFFNKTSRVGLWLSADFQGHDWLKRNGAGQPLSPRWARLQRRKVTNLAGTAFQVARLLTLLAQGRLVDKESSREMISIMTGVHGIGSYIRGALAHAAPPRPFSVIASKIGFGDEKTPSGLWRPFSHDCAIVTVDRGGAPARTIRYVLVALGSHPDQAARADLGKMVVRFHDCVVARHP